MTSSLKIRIAILTTFMLPLISNAKSDRDICFAALQKIENPRDPGNIFPYFSKAGASKDQSTVYLKVGDKRLLRCEVKHPLNRARGTFSEDEAMPPGNMRAEAVREHMADFIRLDDDPKRYLVVDGEAIARINYTSVETTESKRRGYRSSIKEIDVLESSIPLTSDKMRLTGYGQDVPNYTTCKDALDKESAIYREVIENFENHIRLAYKGYLDRGGKNMPIPSCAPFAPATAPPVIPAVPAGSKSTT